MPQLLSNVQSGIGEVGFFAAGSDGRQLLCVLRHGVRRATTRRKLLSVDLHRYFVLLLGNAYKHDTFQRHEMERKGFFV